MLPRCSLPSFAIICDGEDPNCMALSFVNLSSVLPPPPRRLNMQNALVKGLLESRKDFEPIFLIKFFCFSSFFAVHPKFSLNKLIFAE